MENNNIKNDDKNMKHALGNTKLLLLTTVLVIVLVSITGCLNNISYKEYTDIKVDCPTPIPEEAKQIVTKFEVYWEMPDGNKVGPYQKWFMPLGYHANKNEILIDRQIMACYNTEGKLHGPYWAMNKPSNDGGVKCDFTDGCGVCKRWSVYSPTPMMKHLYEPYEVGCTKILDEKISECKKKGGAESEECLMILAVSTGDISVCSHVQDRNTCYGTMAMDKEDPDIIKTYIKTEPDRDLALATYVITTLDGSALDDIKEAKYYNGALIMMMGSFWVKSGKAPIATYCDNLRTDYTYDAETGETVEEAYRSDKNLCEVAAAAVRELAGSEGECENALPTRLVPTPYGYEDEERQENIDACNQMVARIRQNKQRLDEADSIEDITRIMRGLEDEREEI